MTGIEWTDETWNPVTGCSKVSPGCAHCYAEEVTALRAGRPGFIEEHRPWTPANAAHNVRLWPARLEQPLRWTRPRMVFVNSMSDLFHEQVPDEYIARVFDTMAHAPQHTFQVLTKRPNRMRDLLRAWGEADRVLSWPDRLMPLPNVWLGVSIENRRFVYRADLLRETPAAVRFISAEPLLGELAPYWRDGYDGDDLDLAGIDWLIVGGESGPRHRPMNPQWVRDLRDACLATGEHCHRCNGHASIPHSLTWRADSGEPMPAHVNDPCPDCGGRGRRGGTAFFFKQWGGRTPKAGGRELDGRTWDEMPAVRP